MMATYEQWLDAYSDAYDTAPAATDLACPNCEHHSLKLVFTGHLDRMIGYAHFWCDHCLQGIGISRTIIPEDAVAQDIRQSPEEREPKIPNFQLVQ